MPTDLDLIRDGMERRSLINQLNELLSQLRAETYLYSDGTGAVVINQDSNGKYIGIDTTALLNLVPIGSAFRIGVNGTLFPIEPEANFIQAADGHLTITGADNSGAARTDITFDALPDGGNYVFSNDTFTFNTNVWLFSNSTITFNTTTIVIFQGPIVIPGYIVQSPYHWSLSSTPNDPFESGTAQFIIIDPLSSGGTINGIIAPVGTYKDGRFLEIYNNSGFTIIFKHQSSAGGGATAANRIITPNGDDWYLLQGETLFLKYDDTQHRWLILWEALHLRVNSLPVDPPYYFQGINFIGGTNVTITATPSPSKNELQVKIDAGFSAPTAASNLVQTAGPVTSTSGVGADICSLTLTTSGANVLVTFHANYGSTAAYDPGRFNVYVDGVVQGLTDCKTVTPHTASDPYVVAFCLLCKSVSAGSHTYKVAFANGIVGQTGTVTEITMNVCEIL
jgi:hypothetical protein